MITIDFQLGTLLIDGPDNEIEFIRDYVSPDPRVRQFRAQACRYAPIVLTLRQHHVEITDNARKFNPTSFQAVDDFPPRPHQAHAIRNWLNNNKKGVVVMPTGSGKSLVARIAIQQTQRPTLILAPTIDLILQWASQLEKIFQQKIGIIGGGQNELAPITVCTYDSALLKMETIGNQFGLLIFDECHHLPSTYYQQAALMSIAPFRLGLTATPERNDGGERLLDDLIGNEVYRIDICELEGNVLSPYQIQRIELTLDPDERLQYQYHRQIYTTFLRSLNLDLSEPGAWAQFIVACARKKGGREALQSYLEQKRIARAGRSKLRYLWEVFGYHKNERIIIFTADNDTAYTIGRNFFLPVITHNTKGHERKQMLDAFRNGTYTILVTSQVLNEGVDVPEASVGIVVSGTGSIREHVQRLGRILRPGNGKKAILYELISRGTAEFYTSERRRQHNAYRRK